MDRAINCSANFLMLALEAFSTGQISRARDDQIEVRIELRIIEKYHLRRIFPIFLRSRAKLYKMPGDIIGYPFLE